MSKNKETVEAYLAAFRKSDHKKILACLTDDIIWDIPGAFRKEGKEAFDQEIENPAFQGRPDIKVSRLTEENGVVVAEGTVRTQKKTGEFMDLAFCDVFVMREGKIGQLISYLMEVPPKSQLNAQRD